MGDDATSSASSDGSISGVSSHDGINTERSKNGSVNRVLPSYQSLLGPGAELNGFPAIRGVSVLTRTTLSPHFLWCASVAALPGPKVRGQGGGIRSVSIHSVLGTAFASHRIPGVRALEPDGNETLWLPSSWMSLMPHWSEGIGRERSDGEKKNFVLQGSMDKDGTVLGRAEVEWTPPERPSWAQWLGHRVDKAVTHGSIMSGLEPHSSHLVTSTTLVGPSTVSVLKTSSDQLVYGGNMSTRFGQNWFAGLELLYSFKERSPGFSIALAYDVPAREEVRSLLPLLDAQKVEHHAAFVFGFLGHAIATYTTRLVKSGWLVGAVTYEFNMHGLASDVAVGLMASPSGGLWRTRGTISTTSGLRVLGEALVWPGVVVAMSLELPGVASWVPGPARAAAQSAGVGRANPHPQPSVGLFIHYSLE